MVILVEETFKRGIKPFFIPVIVLLSSIIILFNKDNFRYSKIQYFLFSIVFLLLFYLKYHHDILMILQVVLSFSILPINFIFLWLYFFNF